MIMETKNKYKNVTAEAIMIYLSLCEICQKKVKTPKKGLVVKPMVYDEMNSRCQVDLIDMQAQRDGDYRFICVYQDHLTKFVILRPLMNKTAEEVSRVLLDVFTTFGAPNVLQSDNGREFANKLVEKVCSMWDELKIVHGKPRHSQSQGSVERANQDIQNILSAWLETNRTKSWSKGLQFVQFMKNRSYHEGIKMSPYEAMFGMPARLGLKTSSLPNDVIQPVNAEEDLDAVFHCTTEEISSGSDGARELNNVQDENDATNTNNLILLKRKLAKSNLEMQAKKMKHISNSKFPVGVVGNTVRLRIPDVDRARGDCRNILAVIIDVIDGQYYQLGTKE